MQALVTRMRSSMQESEYMRLSPLPGLLRLESEAMLEVAALACACVCCLLLKRRTRVAQCMRHMIIFIWLSGSLLG